MVLGGLYKPFLFLAPSVDRCFEVAYNVFVVLQSG